MISGREFALALEHHGFDFFTGVPCSLIEDLLAVLEHSGRAPYVAAVREDAAVGVAVVTWRGFEGKDAPEHIVTGEITPKLLDLLRIPFRVLTVDSLDRDLAWAAH